MRIRDWVDDHDSPNAPLIPASTAVVVRDGVHGLETLLVRRHARLSFADDMWVFPGGKVDESDTVSGDEHATAVNAAVRETKEEADLELKAETLVHYAHWIPPLNVSKRFSTWFFLAPAPDGAVTVDEGEITDHAWWRPEEALERVHDRRIELLPPTWMTLFDLGQFDSVHHALTEVQAREPRAYATDMRKTPNGLVALWEGDSAYGGGDLDAAGGRHRLTMIEGTWDFELKDFRG